MADENNRAQVEKELALHTQTLGIVAERQAWLDTQGGPAWADSYSPSILNLQGHLQGTAHITDPDDWKLREIRGDVDIKFWRVNYQISEYIRESLNTVLGNIQKTEQLLRDNPQLSAQFSPELKKMQELEAQFRAKQIEVTNGKFNLDPEFGKKFKEHQEHFKQVTSSINNIVNERNQQAEKERQAQREADIERSRLATEKYEKSLRGIGMRILSAVVTAVGDAIDAVASAFKSSATSSRDRSASAPLPSKSAPSGRAGNPPITTQAQQVNAKGSMKASASSPTTSPAPTATADNTKTRSRSNTL